MSIATSYLHIEVAAAFSGGWVAAVGVGKPVLVRSQDTHSPTVVLFGHTAFLLSVQNNKDGGCGNNIAPLPGWEQGPGEQGANHLFHIGARSGHGYW